MDGGSTGNTQEIARKKGGNVFMSSVKRRASQMNLGAREASGSIQHFIHGDAFPPQNFAKDVVKTIQIGYKAGCFRSLFNTSNKFLRINSWFTWFNGILFRGGGQTLYITHDFFEALGGYSETLDIMEEYDFIKRISRKAHFKIIQKDTLVSARTYEKNGCFLLQAKNACVMMMFHLGFSQRKLKKVIHALVK